MENLILYIISIFFLIGAVDYIIGNKLNLGNHFESGIKTMGPLAISMVGIISLTPVITEGLELFLVPLSKSIGIDPSIFISSIIAIDMGAFNVSQNIAVNDSMVHFAGVLMASTLGCTLSFTLPLALGIVKKDSRKDLFTGIVFGIITLPIGLFFGGLMLKIPAQLIIINLLPIIIIALILSFGIFYSSNITISILNVFGKGIVIISIIGIAIQGFQSISGIVIMDNLMPLDETLNIVGRIAIFLGGAYVLLEVIKRMLKSKLKGISEKFNISENSIVAFIGSLASAIVVFSTFEELDSKGKILCTAFSVGGAYVLGGQLGFVASESKEITLIYITTKLICGFLAVIIGIIYIKRKNKVLIKAKRTD